MASVKEVSITHMSEAQRYTVYENFAAETLDPSQLLEQLEQLAIESGWNDVHAFIRYHNSTH